MSKLGGQIEKLKKFWAGQDEHHPKAGSKGKRQKTSHEKQAMRDITREQWFWDNGVMS